MLASNTRRYWGVRLSASAMLKYCFSIASTTRSRNQAQDSLDRCYKCIHRSSRCILRNKPKYERFRHYGCSLVAYYLGPIPRYWVLPVFGYLDQSVWCALVSVLSILITSSQLTNPSPLSPSNTYEVTYCQGRTSPAVTAA